MRLFAVLGALAALAACALACAPEPLPTGDDCQKARAVFTRCGVSVPILTDGPCTGMQHAIARCVANHASTCDELSTLVGRIDACVADELDGGELPPLGDLPVPPPYDAGRDARADADFVPPDAPLDDVAPPPDAGAHDAADAADALAHSPVLP